MPFIGMLVLLGPSSWRGRQRHWSLTSSSDDMVQGEVAGWALDRRETRDYRRLALAHPHAVALLVTRPLATPLGRRAPGVLRPLEDFLELLVNAGFSAAEALRAYRLFFGFLTGHVLDELQEVVDNPEESDDLLRLGLHRFPRDEFPQLRAVAGELATYDGAAHLEQGVTMMLTGLQNHFRPARADT